MRWFKNLLEKRWRRKVEKEFWQDMQQASANDVLKEIGDISDEEMEYYAPPSDKFAKTDKELKKQLEK